LHEAFGEVEEHAAVTGQPDRPPRPGEKRHAQLGLEPGHRTRQRGLRHPEDLRRAGEMLLTRDDRELAQPGRERVECRDHIGAIGGRGRPGRAVGPRTFLIHF
jgi:hypothetical protein